ncbi:nitrate reductase cytochrome c-type subunit [Marinithermus hydrothermalis]|uniref:Periplasmic nitrate reductase, electron transfer subunit n=1 Tax=Marinithermus hydrothermalis (strain DSM 14884 / JCM 11576 / T1) TaxID=869210 RepID=F2NPN9_MARHT|nr:nitrate reductase cytochrome c-type subunit [Marinithermus hydrothermalis]AEB12540.1 Nitrate reductase cytochrome c-type subunit (NapB) [Marinithermus hydrothermalis DSM 14884]
MTRHKRILWIGLALLGIGLVFFALGLGNAPSFTPQDLGIRNAVLETDAGAELPPLAYPTTPPGASERMPRSQENAPPMIPHSIEGFVPVTQSQNSCAACHNPNTAQALGATPIPPTHYALDLFSDTDTTSLQLDAARYSCTMCHAPQAEVDPPIANLFIPEFRNPDGQFSSDLMERWKEGVDLETGTE